MLTAEEVSAPPPMALGVVVGAVKRFRDSHHAVARLCALGHRNGEVAQMTGYSVRRVESLLADPAFQNLVAKYRTAVDEAWRAEAAGYFANLNKARDLAVRMIVDQLEEADEADDRLPIRTLLAIQADAADRTGYPKRSVAINVNLDFAQKLEAAIKRSNKAKVIEHEPAGQEQSMPPSPAPQPGPAPAEVALSPLEPVPPHTPPPSRDTHRVSLKTRPREPEAPREPIRRRA